MIKTVETGPGDQAAFPTGLFALQRETTVCNRLGKNLTVYSCYISLVSLPAQIYLEGQLVFAK